VESKKGRIRGMKRYWEVIADNLSKADAGTAGKSAAASRLGARTACGAAMTKGFNHKAP
jgi:hypothetical protein